MFAACVAAALTGAAHAQDEWSKPDYAYEFSENDGVGYEDVVVNGHYRNFAPIHAAAARGDVVTIRAEIAKGVPADLPVVNRGGGSSWRGTTALHWAALYGQAEAIRALLDAGANIEERAERGATPLMIAAGAVPTINGDHAQCVRLLIERGAKLEARDEDDDTALCYAASKSALLDEPPKELLRPEHRLRDQFRNLRPGVGGSIGGMSDEPQCVLRTRHGDAERMRILLEAGASATTPNVADLSPLIHAVRQSDPERVRILIGAGAVPRPGAELFHWSPLLEAARTAPFPVFMAMLQASGGSEAVLRSPVREEVLASAATGFEGRIKIEHFIDAGWDPAKDAAVADRVLQAAASGWGEGLSSMVPLLRSGIPPPDRIFDQWSMLGFAAQHGSAEVLAELLSVFGTANVNRAETDETASTLLMLAAQSDLDAGEKVRMLIDAGAEVEAKDLNGQTAIVRAAHAGRMSAVAALARAGAEVKGSWGQPGLQPEFAAKVTVLHLACAAGSGTFLSEEPQEDAINALLERGAEIDALAEGSGEAPIDWAITLAFPDYQLMADEPGLWLSEKVLLGPGHRLADPNPFHRDRRSDSIVRLMLERGANASRRDARGATLLMRVCESVTDPALAQLLVEHGADVKAKDKDDCTVAHYAAGALNADLVEYLTSKGVDWSAIDRMGRRPIDLARLSRAQDTSYYASDDDLDKRLERFEALMHKP